MGILQTTQHEYVIFDPANDEHKAAYWHIRTTGRQLNKLRFIVEEGFSSVLTMMQSKLADHCCKPPVVPTAIIHHLVDKRDKK